MLVSSPAVGSNSRFLRFLAPGCESGDRTWETVVTEEVDSAGDIAPDRSRLLVIKDVVCDCSFFDAGRASGGRILRAGFFAAGSVGGRGILANTESLGDNLIRSNKTSCN